MTPRDYKMLRLTPETHRLLRILAAQAGETIIQLVERLAVEEEQRQKEKGS